MFKIHTRCVYFNYKCVQLFNPKQENIMVHLILDLKKKSQMLLIQQKVKKLPCELNNVWCLNTSRIKGEDVSGKICYAPPPHPCLTKGCIWYSIWSRLLYCNWLLDVMCLFVLCLFLKVSWADPQCVMVTFDGHTTYFCSCFCMKKSKWRCIGDCIFKK